ncbi:hypothetical protein PIB30_083483 [Stylosanthes scabra]|uniref:DUF4283 domain-containing protein n=1 Tax=Stylosanthes scabra TaxID=79078 RepID=A0ABU6SUF5_9FABA|nr:hypothetical protein [Stylosanthes scabra]
MFFVGTKESAMGAIWSRPVGFKVADLGKNLFHFFFDCENDADRIVKGSLWLFKGFILHLDKWKEGVNNDDQSLRSFPLWVQFWGLPEQFKTLEVGRKLARRVGEVLEVDLFEVKGKENQIVKARVELNGPRKVRDSLRLLGPNIDQLEQNIVRQGALGEWIKADQVGRQIFNNDFKSSEGNANGNWSSSKPEKKPPPDWLANGISKLNLKGNLKGDNRMKMNQVEQKEEKGRLSSEGGGRTVLSKMVVPMNTEENIVVGGSYTPTKRNIQKIKQDVRQKRGNGKIGSGRKRAISGKENFKNGKRICLESRDLKEAGGRVPAVNWHPRNYEAIELELSGFRETLDSPQSY